jgi:hypothetical protein
MKVMNNNSQTQPVQGQHPPTNPVPSPVNPDDGYNVTAQVNPMSIDQTQVLSDLAALKAAEGELSPSPAAVKKVVKVNKPQELAALELQNPFRGE